ncbi:hypothetical protein HALO59_40083 [Halomonas sp. 59]|nr:hypothetical protein HALOI3_20232 [Halomonas sp. I3]CAD5275581.1 hypothetical protein HALO113_40233 [Halomonas sp. 113]CAD5276392.1 hypothetical protein HALO156_170026 [Halomonas sp. 156]CAD5277308.1 hypothetical protein HALO59_40083 [Halomonas sp. 59]VXC00768.1 hypothetical protein HALO98_40231 [Halomonas titanicae]
MMDMTPLKRQNISFKDHKPNKSLKQIFCFSDLFHRTGENVPMNKHRRNT